jgi:hypothetical protein
MGPGARLGIAFAHGGHALRNRDFLGNGFFYR